MDNLLQRVRLALADTYEIEAEVGRGGMAVVYRATDLRHHRTVAVKVLPPHLASAVGHERFLQEIRMSAGLSHPYVLPLLDSGEADGLLYYVMPFVDGESLAEKVSLEGPLPIETAMGIAGEMAEALGHAHSLGIIHRDIKPSNILLTHEHAVLADFGVAFALRSDTNERLTGTGLSVGTPAYMSPQQGLPDAHVDGAGDQYSLACVIYEMFTGGPPFVGPSSDAVFRSHVMDPVPDIRAARPTVPAGAAAALERALSKSPDDRFPSMEEFAEAFRSVAAPIPVANGPDRHFLLWKRTWLVVGIGVAGLFGWSALTMDGPDVGPTATEESLAFLPCRAHDATDNTLGRNVAWNVELTLQGFPWLVVTPFDESDQWATQQQIRGLSLSDSTDRARRELQASILGVCEVSPVGDDSVEVAYQLYGMPRDVRESVRLARRNANTANVGPLVVELVGLLLEGSAFRPTDDIDALTHYFHGYHSFLENRLIEAEHYFGQAAAVDPEFALARWRQADVRRWEAKPGLEDIDIRRLFEESGDRLGRRDSLLLSALTQPPGPERFTQLESVLELIPDDAYATLLYGDELQHRGPLWGVTLDSAEAVLEKATQLDSLFSPAWDHLAQVRIRLGMKDAAEYAVERLEALAEYSPGDGIPVAIIWRHGWHERFDPDTADLNRPMLAGDPGLLAMVARNVRYFDLPRAQLELSRALLEHPATAAESEAWHSGVNARGLALASLGQPAASTGAFARAADATPSSALFADQWAVIPFALGLEGFSRDAARAAAVRLAAIAGDTLSEDMHRGRAAWAMALLASTEDSDNEFEGWKSRTAELTGEAGPLSRHLDAVGLARDGRWVEALEASQSLVAYDSVGNTERPFARSAFHLHRGAWFDAAGRPDSAVAAWTWYLNTDLEAMVPRVIQAGEVDGALGTHARLRIARLGSSTSDANLTARSCVEAGEVVRRWSAPELSLTEAVADAVRIAESCPP